LIYGETTRQRIKGFTRKRGESKRANLPFKVMRIGTYGGGKILEPVVCEAGFVQKGEEHAGDVKGKKSGANNADLSYRASRSSGRGT